MEVFQQLIEQGDYSFMENSCMMQHENGFYHRFKEMKFYHHKFFFIRLVFRFY
jgi:hypothetical protein